MRKLIVAVTVMVFMMAWAVDGLVVAVVVSSAYAWGARQVSKWRGL